MTTALESFAAARGLTVAQLAVQIGVEPMLLTRVSQGRQPLREQHVRAVAARFGVPVADAEALFPSRVRSNDARLDTPKPPIPVRGDAIPPAVVAVTRDAP